jgi:hypothetical protein
MTYLPKPRRSISLSPSLRTKLDSYCLAAGATGFGLAALASPLQAEVVFTPAHQEIGRNGVFIDLNHDGIQDFEMFQAEFFARSGGVLVSSLGANRVLSTGQRGWVSNLAAGYRVGPNSLKFQPGGTFSSKWGPAKLLYDCQDNSGFETCVGPWDKTQNAYVGFQFSIAGQTHYGWARLKQSVPSFYEVHTYLTGYAYETIPNKPIVTGKTSGPSDQSATRPESSSATLGMLSAGSTALPLWRLPVQ